MKTLRNAEAFKELGVEFIEQPMPAADWEGMRKVYADSALPLIADESCIVESDVQKCHSLFPRHQYKTHQMRRHHARPQDDPGSENSWA